MNPPQQFVQMACAIEALQTEHNQLSRLLEVVRQNSDVFFNSEIDKVRASAAQKGHQLRALQKELATRVQLYEGEVAMLEAALAKRQALMDSLDTDTGVLKNNNALLNTFAQGQVTLQNDLKRLRKRVGVDAA
jgi:hypothetical protein